MYAGWNLVPTFIVTVFCAQSLAFWPFSVHAATDAPESLFANTNAKRVAVIGMYSSKFHVTSVFNEKITSFRVWSLPNITALASAPGLLEQHRGM
jgi:hypothetical protein